MNAPPRARRSRALSALSFVPLLVLVACGGGGGRAAGPQPSLKPAWQIYTPSLDFGATSPGTPVSRFAEVRNVSAGAMGTVVGVALPSGGFSISPTPFPVLVDPGAFSTFVVRFDPSDFETHSGQILIDVADSPEPLAIDVTGTGVETIPTPNGSEEVTDLGNQPFTSGVTATLSVTVPADAISLTLEGTPVGVGTIGLHTFTGPSGRVYENSTSSGAYYWNPSTDVFVAQVPNTDRPNVQLVAGGGTYNFQLRLMTGTAPSVHVRCIVERRPAGWAGQGVLDLNVWFAKGLNVSLANAPDSRLSKVLAKINTALSQRGIALGDIDYYALTDSKFDQVSEAEIGPLLSTSAEATQVRLNLFFVMQTLEGGVVGVSAALGGPKVNGTAVSGVMSTLAYNLYSEELLGLVAAHEIGHYLGLYHTVEVTGQHDFVDDTAECPPNATSTACPIVGGGYLMHWQALGGQTISNGQGLVIRGHPCCAPAPGGSPKPVPWAVLDDSAPADAWMLAPGWCGTCATCGKQTAR